MSLGVLRDRNFRLLWAGSTISGAKGSETTTAQGAMVPSSGPKGTPRAM